MSVPEHLKKDLDNTTNSGNQPIAIDVEKETDAMVSRIISEAREVAEKLEYLDDKRVIHRMIEYLIVTRAANTQLIGRENNTEVIILNQFDMLKEQSEMLKKQSSLVQQQSELINSLKDLLETSAS